MPDIVETNNIQNPIIENIPPFDAVHQTTNSFNSYTHYHPNYYELYIFLSGTATLHLEGKLYKLYKGDTFFISPKTPHMVKKLDSISSYSRIVIHISPDLMGKISLDEEDFNFFIDNMLNKRYRLSQQELSTIVYYTDMLSCELNSNIKPCQWMLIRSFYSLIISCIIRHTQSTPSKAADYPETIQSILLYIDKHLTEENLSIQNISDNLNVSASYISHTFKKYFNESIWQHIIHKRLLIAQKLLLSGKSVTYTCFSCGFTSYSNFIKTFSKVFGSTPYKYVLKQKEYSHEKTINLF
jgi:trancriptional regulator of araC family protein